MMEQRMVLVPLDGSASSEAAIPYAVAVGRALGATLRLLRVVDTTSGYFFLEQVEWDKELIGSLRDEALSYVEQRRSVLRDQGMETSTAVAVGNATEEILRDAKVAGASMIVMATRGRGGLQRWVLGSVADKVMRMGRVPTLLVGPSEAADPVRAVALRTLLLPLDGSHLAEAALEPAVALAEATGAKLFLLHVEPWASTSMAFGGGMYIPDLAESEGRIDAVAWEYLRSICAKIPSAVHYQAFVERGVPSPALEQFIAEEHVDLVVMSTHGRGGLARLAIGSTADRLVRAGAPTLLIRPAAIADRGITREGAEAVTG
jgi:nucleotide-binding universal stress UspA family protein